MSFSIENKIIYVLVWVNGCEIELKDSLGMEFSIENKKIFVLVWRIFVLVVLQQSSQFPTKNSELKPQRERIFPIKLLYQVVDLKVHICIAVFCPLYWWRSVFRTGCTGLGFSFWPRWDEGTPLLFKCLYLRRKRTMERVEAL